VRHDGGESGVSPDPAQTTKRAAVGDSQILHRRHEGYITVGLYEDGTPGEVFISMAKEGSTISGLMDSFATSISYALQYGVRLKFFVDKFSHVRLSRAAGPAIRRFPTRNPSWIIFSLDGNQVPGPEYAVTRRAMRWCYVQPSRTAAGLAVRSSSQRRAAMLRMRWVDDAERKLLQVRELRGTSGCS